MTRVAWERLEQTRAFEDMVAVLISRLHPAAERIDGSGGDGGRDVQLRTPARLDLFELKSFTGRVTPRSPNRRRQVEESLERAAALKPDSWTLVVPINHNKWELRWFDSLRAKYGCPLHWKGRDWLDDQLAAFPDICRYYVDGAADEVVRLLAELHREEAILHGGVNDALDRLRALKTRLNEIDPQYRIEFSPGPIEAAAIAYPGAVMYQEQGRIGEQPWTLSVFPKYRDAMRDRPIEIKANLRFDRTESSEQERRRFLELMNYGAGVPTLITDAEMFVDAPAGLGGNHESGVLSIWPLPDEIKIDARLEITNAAGARVASTPLRFSSRTRGDLGITLTGDHSTGLLGMTLTLVLGERVNCAVEIRPPVKYAPSEVLPILRFLSTMAAPNLLGIRIDGVDTVAPTPLTEPPPVEPSFVTMVESLARIQAETGTYFTVEVAPTPGDLTEIHRLITLLDGGEIPLTPDTLDLTGSGERDDLSLGAELQTIAVQFWHETTLLGADVPIGGCHTVGGPWHVTDKRPTAEGIRFVLTPGDGCRWVLRRGLLTPDPVGPRTRPKVLIPAALELPSPTVGD